MDAMENWLRRAACIFAAIGGAVMLVMLALVTANMVSRPFGGTVRGTVEVSGYLCALGIGLCMPAAQMAGSHIAAGLWIASLPRPVQRIQGGAGNLLCAILLVFVGRELCDIAGYAFDLGEIIEGFGISHGGMAVGFACGIALHALMFLHAFLRTFFPVLPVRPAPAGRAQEGA
jgi:TRAP-type C4-dicarboxylate transport system permease small subunit